jgi:hypothetical protein
MSRQLIRVATLILLATAAASGCAQFDPYRPLTIGYESASNARIAPLIAECFSGPPQQNLSPCESSNDAAAGHYAIQRRHYRYTNYNSDGTSGLATADYHLAFVEFDDQGWFVDRKQMEALFMLLHRLERQSKEQRNSTEDGHTLILIYAHGWMHDASQCDNNVLCFSRLLERVDILERHLEQARGKARVRTPRNVVGVYVGWRGLSVTAGPLSNITFWTRKSTAERVGRGGVTELLTRLNEYRAIRNPHREYDKTQLIVAGHSFGGLIIYSALSHALMERATNLERVEGADCDQSESRPFAARDHRTCYQTATSFGDLVVLVNPALEGSQYEPLYHIATNRCYGPRQRPVMLTVTSEGDQATGIAFPLGRKVSTLAERARSSEQDDAILKTVGHAARYETHKLKWIRRSGPTAADRRPAPEESNCGCPYLEPTATFDWRQFAADVKLVPQQPFQPSAPQRVNEPVRPSQREGGRIYDVYTPDVQLIGDSKYSSNFPYLVVKADREIINGHNDIYNEPFVRFLHSFFLVHIANRRPFEAEGCWKTKDVQACQLDGLIPCEESCRLADGKSCSGRMTDGIAGPPG